MLEIEIKLSHEMLRLIADIERFTGFWPRVAQNELLTSEANEMAALLEAIACLSELEESMPPHARYLAREQRSTAASVASRSELDTQLRGQPLLANFAAAYHSPCTLTRKDFLYLQNLIVNGGQQPTQFQIGRASGREGV